MWHRILSSEFGSHIMQMSDYYRGKMFKGTVQPFEWWFLRRISALLIEKIN
jgi:hypothetical protein